MTAQTFNVPRSLLITNVDKAGLHVSGAEPTRFLKQQDQTYGGKTWTYVSEWTTSGFSTPKGTAGSGTLTLTEGGVTQVITNVTEAGVHASGAEPTRYLKQQDVNEKENLGGR